MDIRDCNLKALLSTPKKRRFDTLNKVLVVPNFVIATDETNFIRYSVDNSKLDSRGFGIVENPHILYSRGKADLIFGHHSEPNTVFPTMDEFFGQEAEFQTVFNPQLLFQLCQIAGIENIGLCITDGHPQVISDDLPEFAGIIAKAGR